MNVSPVRTRFHQGLLAHDLRYAFFPDVDQLVKSGSKEDDSGCPCPLPTSALTMGSYVLHACLR